MPEFEEQDGRLVWTLVPGFIKCMEGVCSSNPTLVGRRMPTHVTWPWHYLDNPEMLEQEGYSREEVIALYAFNAGVQYQRGRAKRKRWDAEIIRRWREKELPNG